MKKLKIFSLIIFVLFIFTYVIVDARAGWGGSSGSGDGGWAIWAVIAWLIYAIYEIRRRKMIKKAKKDLEEVLKSDSTWNIKSLKEDVKNVFSKYQKARWEKDLTSVKHLMTKKYYEKAKKIMDKKLSWKINIIKDIKIHEMNLMSVRDMPGRDWDMFAMEVSASMIDYTINEKTWKFIRSTMPKRKNETNLSYQNRAMTSASEFKEYYIFIRYDWKWLLNNIKEKFSIVWDIISLKEKDLRKVLEQEESTDYVDDSVFYKD